MIPMRNSAPGYINYSPRRIRESSGPYVDACGPGIIQAKKTNLDLCGGVGSPAGRQLSVPTQRSCSRDRGCV